MRVAHAGSVQHLTDGDAGTGWLSMLMGVPLYSIATQSWAAQIHFHKVGLRVVELPAGTVAGGPMMLSIPTIILVIKCDCCQL